MFTVLRALSSSYLVHISHHPSKKQNHEEEEDEDDTIVYHYDGGLHDDKKGCSIIQQQVVSEDYNTLGCKFQSIVQKKKMMMNHHHDERDILFHTWHGICHSMKQILLLLTMSLSLVTLLTTTSSAATASTRNTNVCQCQSSLSSFSLDQQQQEGDDEEDHLLVSSSSSTFSSDENVSSLHDTYDILWNHVPLGFGSFGTVYEAIHRTTGIHYAIKRISKKYTYESTFQNELSTLLWVKKQGGHPHICTLHDFYQDTNYYYLVLDLVNGGELFDVLVQRGSYSELDASRIFRDLTSAIYFLHGIGVIHGDMKPENCLLSMKDRDDALIQITDFGCASFENKNHHKNHGHDDDYHHQGGGNTIAYSPPEILLYSYYSKNQPNHQNTNRESTMNTPIDYPIDIWSLGIMLYIMLTGVHPFDLTGQATDEEIQDKIILEKAIPPIYRSPITAHLSSSALDVIDQCLKWNPQERITAFDLLQHPWVQGQNVNTDKMIHSDKKLASLLKKYKSKVEAQVFANLFTWSTKNENDTTHKNIYKNASLIERVFHSLDIENKGFLSTMDICRHVVSHNDVEKEEHDDDDDESAQKSLISLSQFSNLIHENMKNRYFPSGCTIYNEGDVGNHMFFINSGSVRVTTLDGISSQRSQGDFFGEGALVLNSDKKRSATVQCLTPVHLIEISREDFEKYAASSHLSWDIKEKDNERKKNRVKTILRLQKELREIHLNKGDYFFRAGEEADSLYILERGRAECLVEDKKVFTLKPGDICGEFSLIMGRPRNSSIVCVSDLCIAQQMKAENFQELYQTISSISRASLREICLRREFQKALVKYIGKDFPSVDDLLVVFDSAKKGNQGYLTINDVRDLLQSFDRTLTEDEIQDVLRSLDLDGSGEITFEKFRIIFGSHMNLKEIIRLEP